MDSDGRNDAERADGFRNFDQNATIKLMVNEFVAARTWMIRYIITEVIQSMLFDMIGAVTFGGGRDDGYCRIEAMSDLTRPADSEATDVIVGEHTHSDPLPTEDA